MTLTEFIEALAGHGIHLTQTQIDQFERYFELLIEWNQKMNLTAITDRAEVYLKHFYDSLLPLWLTPQTDYAVSLADVGAGAGFPSLPMKIIYPELQVTIIDSLNKRIQFLHHLIKELNLTDVHCVHGRAEDIGQDKKYRGQFDLVTARAVAPLNVLCEYCLPLAKKGGHFIALKGQQGIDEVQEAKGAIATLGAKLIDTYTETLPEDEGERTIVLIKKTLDTPNKYPRRAGRPTKDPLV